MKIWVVMYNNWFDYNYDEERKELLDNLFYASKDAAVRGLYKHIENENKKYESIGFVNHLFLVPMNDDSSKIQLNEKYGDKLQYIGERGVYIIEEREVIEHV